MISDFHQNDLHNYTKALWAKWRNMDSLIMQLGGVPSWCLRR